MAYIYKITNQINGKSYIGKTLKSIKERFREHCQDSKRDRCKDRPLYRAFNKYGIENFSVEQIEECSDKIVNEREVYWIEYYQTFKNGYNATTGGDGKHYLDYDLICETYKNVQNTIKVAEICNCSCDSVRNILKERNILMKTSPEVMKREYGKIINMYDLNDNYIKTFPTISEAARYIQALIPQKRSNLRGIGSHISDVARGKRKTAYKYKWKFN